MFGGTGHDTDSYSTLRFARNYLDLHDTRIVRMTYETYVITILLVSRLHRLAVSHLWMIVSAHNHRLKLMCILRCVLQSHTESILHQFILVRHLSDHDAVGQHGSAVIGIHQCSTPRLRIGPDADLLQMTQRLHAEGQ